MKLYYPYFNLFYKAGTENYRLDTLVKIPGKCVVDKIEQNLVGDYWEVRIRLSEKQNSIDAEKEKLAEFSIELVPSNIKELDKIKIIVKNYDNHLRNGDPDGEGKTGLTNGEEE